MVGLSPAHTKSGVQSSTQSKKKSVIKPNTAQRASTHKIHQKPKLRVLSGQKTREDAEAA